MPTVDFSLTPNSATGAPGANIDFLITIGNTLEFTTGSQGFTMDDGGGGGTLTPSSCTITWPALTYPFTYSNNTAGTYTITLTPGTGVMHGKTPQTSTVVIAVPTTASTIAGTANLTANPTITTPPLSISATLAGAANLTTNAKSLLSSTIGAAATLTEQAQAVANSTIAGVGSLSSTALAVSSATIGAAASLTAQIQESLSATITGTAGLTASTV